MGVSLGHIQAECELYNTGSSPMIYISDVLTYPLRATGAKVGVGLLPNWMLSDQKRRGLSIS